jgi:CRISPR-associated protein Csx10
LKNHSGFWGEGHGKQTEPKQRWRRSVAVHVGIDRYTHTAAESLLFALPALEPVEATAVLRGIMEADDQAFADLRALLDQAQGEIHVGHARTRGYGQVRLAIGSSPATQAADWEGWSRALLTFLADPSLGIPAMSPERHFLFSLSLPTGAILLDEMLRYTLDPARMVPWLPPLPPPDATEPTRQREGTPLEGGRLWCVTASTKQERVRGWNAAHGLPRQDEWAVVRGSVYAYLFEGDLASRDALKRRLEDLEQTGVGARRNEGFGRVVVSDDFHRRFHQQEPTP